MCYYLCKQQDFICNRSNLQNILWTVRHVLSPPHLFRCGFLQPIRLILIPDSDIGCMLGGIGVGCLVEATINII